jgi:DNA-binding XRE family transcriptional regulator
MRKKLNKERKTGGKRTMHQFQYLVNLLNQMLAALLGIFLAIRLKLRNARQAKGLTIEEAAELLGVAPGTYSRWERLRQRPHPSHRLLLLQTFGPDIEEEEDGYVPDAFLPPSYWN